MTQGGLFYNIHPSVNESRIIAQWLAQKPPAVVVMNNPGLAAKLIASRPDALVIARQRDDADEVIANLGTPKAWLARMRNLYPHPRIVLYAGNECHASPGVDSWMVDTMRLATVAGRRLCILNCGTGGPEAREWWPDAQPTSTSGLPAYRVGILEPVIRELFKPENSGHLLGLHEYINALDYTDPSNEWQLRHEKHFDIWEQMGIPATREEMRARVVITEASFDSVQNSNWKGSRHLDAKEAARQMIAIDQTIYKGIPLCMYCIGSNNDPQWSLFRLDNTDINDTSTDEWGQEFQRIIGAYMVQSQQPDPDPDPEPEEPITMPIPTDLSR